MPRAGDRVLKEKKSQGLAERVAKKKETRKLSSAQRNPTQHKHNTTTSSWPIEGGGGKALAQAVCWTCSPAKGSGQEEMGRDGRCKDVQSTGTIAAN